MPLSITMVNNQYPKNAGLVTSLMTLFGTSGLMLIPWIVGIISDLSKFWYGILFLSFFPLLIALLSAFLSSPEERA